MAGRRTKGQEAAGTLTVQCEWFPVAAPAGDMPDSWRRGKASWLETEARLFGSAVRRAFNRLADGLTKRARGKPTTTATEGTAPSAPAERVETSAAQAATLRLELKRGLQTAFGLNSRYADDAILKANEVIGSQATDAGRANALRSGWESRRAWRGSAA